MLGYLWCQDEYVISKLANDRLPVNLVGFIGVANQKRISPVFDHISCVEIYCIRHSLTRSRYFLQHREITIDAVSINLSYVNLLNK